MKYNTTLYLVRHGTTEMNNANPTEDRIKGWMDVPLDADGLKVAHGAAQALKPFGITHIVSSDLRRAAQTAHIIGSKLGAQVAVTPRLRPWDSGSLSGMPYSEVGDTLKKFQEETPDTPLPGGEPYNEFLNRWRKALPELLDLAKANNNRVAAVVHSRNILALDAVMRGDSLNKVKVFGAPPPGSVLALHVNS